MMVVESTHLDDGGVCVTLGQPTRELDLVFPSEGTRCYFVARLTDLGFRLAGVAHGPQGIGRLMSWLADGGDITAGDGIALPEHVEE